MEGKGIVFSKEYNKTEKRDITSFSIVVRGDTNEYLATIEALLSLLGNPPGAFDDQGDKYYVCELIRAMLPSFEQVQMIEKSQVQQ